MPAPPRKVAPTKASRTCHTCCDEVVGQPGAHAAHDAPLARGAAAAARSGTSAAREGGTYGVCTAPSSPTNGPGPAPQARPQGTVSGSAQGRPSWRGTAPADHDRAMTSPTSEGQHSRPRLVLLRRPRHRHPAAHRQQVGRRRLLGHRRPAAHRPRGRAGRSGRSSSSSAASASPPTSSPGCCCRTSEDRIPAERALRDGDARVDRAARRRRDRPGQRLPVVVRRPRRGVGLPVGPAP